VATAAFAQKARFTDDSAGCMTDELESTEVMVNIHPTTPDKVIMVVLALELIHLFQVVFKDEEKRSDSYFFELLQLCENSTLMYNLHSHHSEQVADIQVAKGSIVDAEQVHDQVLPLESFYSEQQSLLLF
jgi:hypothetical protein